MSWNIADSWGPKTKLSETQMGTQPIPSTIPELLGQRVFQLFRSALPCALDGTDTGKGLSQTYTCELQTSGTRVVTSKGVLISWIVRKEKI